MVPDAPRVDGGAPTVCTRPEGHTKRSNESASSIGMPQKTKLAAWRVTGNSTLQQEFQGKLLNYWWPIEAKERTRLTSLDGSDGVARDGKLIPFLVKCSYFLDFITSLFQEGLQYCSINLIRSAVSTAHLPVDGTPIGKHPPPW